MFPKCGKFNKSIKNNESNNDHASKDDSTNDT
jgi:hypothetical protein